MGITKVGVKMNSASERTVCVAISTQENHCYEDLPQQLPVEESGGAKCF